MNRKRISLSVGALVACVLLSSCTQVTVSEPGPAALTPGSGENTATVKAVHIGSTNPGFRQGECPSDGWGWHFVLPGNSTDFVQLNATFTRDGERVTLLASEYEPTEKHAYVYTDGPGWELAASEALVRGTERTYNLSHVCTGPDGEATTTAPSTTTTTVPDEPTTTTPGDTTSLTQGGITSTSIAETTTTAEAATTTTGEGPPTTTETTTPSVETTTTVTSTTVAETTSSSDPGESTSTTTTDGEVGGGSITSAAGGQGGGSTTTSGGDIGSDTLPRTGGGEIPFAGLAGLLLAAGATLLLVLRRTKDSD